MSKENKKNPRLGAVGGQAVLEGVMMKHDENCSVAVRCEDGSITVENSKFQSVRKKHKILNIPLLRGVINMVEMMILSVRTLNASAKLLGIEEGEESRFEKWVRKKFGKSVFDFVMIAMVFVAMLIAVGLFILLPTSATFAIEKLFDLQLDASKSIVEGVMKIVIFVAYLLLISLMKDIRRTFQYHGAEHKAVFCYESGDEMTVENVRRQSRFHPRCGTSFMFVAVLVSILVSSLPFVPTDNAIARILCKFALLPLIIGVGFEFIKLAGKHNNIVIRLLSSPGLLMQKITTKEPDDSQIEIAIYALKSAMPEQFPDFVPPIKQDESERPQTDEQSEPERPQTDEQSEPERPQSDEQDESERPQTDEQDESERPQSDEQTESERPQTVEQPESTEPEVES